MKYAEYGYRNDATAYADVFALIPTRMLAWTAFVEQPSDFRHHAPAAA
ncbi:hypothetical protein ACFQU3_03540 [Terrabacter sp. GCM10028922]